MTKFNFNLNRASYIGLVAFAFFLLNSCGYNYQDSFQQSVIQVDFYEVKPISVTTRSSFPGSMEGSVNVDVKSQVTGYLDYIYVDEGNYVRKGQPLFMIKSDIYNEQVINSKATLESALAELFKKGLVTIEDALAKSSKPAELKRLIQG